MKKLWLYLSFALIACLMFMGNALADGLTRDVNEIPPSANEATMLKADSAASIMAPSLGSEELVAMDTDSQREEYEYSNGHYHDFGYREVELDNGRWDIEYTGICDVCGYVCPHPEKERYTFIDEENTYIDTGSDSKHLRQSRVYRKTLCKNCWMIISKELLDSGDSNEEHSFSIWNNRNEEGLVCIQCGYQRKKPCEHTNTYIVHSNDPLDWYRVIEAQNLGEQGHLVTGFCEEEYVVCADCGSVVETRTDVGPVTDICRHNFFESNGVCVDCGFVNTCLHPAEYITYRMGDYGSDQYEPVDSEYHKVYRYGYLYACELCGEIWEYQEDVPVDFQGHKEKHTFTANGLCKYCGYEKKGSGSSSSNGPSSIAIVQGERITIAVGQKIQLDAEVSPRHERAVLTWQSSKPSVASVDVYGVVTPRSEGTARITVSTQNGKKTYTTVYVSDPNKPSAIGIIEGTEATLTVGQSLQLNTILAPETAQATLTWKSSKEKVAIVDANGLVVARSEGKAKVTVATQNKKRTSITINVVDPYKPSAIGIIEGTEATLAVGQSLQLSTILAPETAQATLTWKSSKEKVATVDANGLVVAQSEGKAKVTVATQNKKKTTITINVIDPYTPYAIGIIEGKEVTLAVGQPLQLTVLLAPETAQATLSWSSKKPEVATVDANGLVIAQSAGKTKITVTTQNKKKTSIKVNVVE